MGMVIWKYKLKMFGVQEIDMPSASRILSVQMQGDSPALWALVNEQARGTTVIEMWGTGDYPNPDSEYIGTVQDGKCAWHFFRRL